jgi:hypothetical protein
MGEWKPDETAQAEGCTNWCTAHSDHQRKWTVHGRRRKDLTSSNFSNGFRTLKNGTPGFGKLNGDQINFTGRQRPWLPAAER